MATNIDPQSDLRALTTTRNGITYSLCSGGHQLIETTSIDVQDYHPGVTCVMDFKIRPHEYGNTYMYVNVLGTYRVLGIADKKIDKKQLLDRIAASAYVPVHGAIIDIASMKHEERRAWNLRFGRHPEEDRPIYAEYTRHGAANAFLNAHPETPAPVPTQANPQAGVNTITQPVLGSGNTSTVPAPATATTRGSRACGGGEIPISASEWYEILGSWLAGASYHQLCEEYCPHYHTAGHHFSSCDVCTRYKQRTHYYKRVKKMGKNGDGTRWVDEDYLEGVRVEAEAEAEGG